MQERILVCEDERFVRWALAEHLRESGYSVFEAADGIAALDIIGKSKPDAILLDLHMPRMDGFNVIRELKSSNSDIPVFVISGYGQANANNMAAELGINGFIRKPFRLNEIDKLLENIL